MSKMRSVKYVLGGKPQNRQDCIHYARKHGGVLRIIAELRGKEEVTEQWARVIMYVIYIWIFNDTAATYEESLGACYQHEDEVEQKRSIDNANRRFASGVDSLKLVLQEAGIKGVEFEGDGKRFPYSTAQAWGENNG